MIAFELCCSQGHTFEGWFDSSEAYETQKMQGLVVCPVCDDTKIAKQLSPVKSVNSRQADDEAKLAAGIFKAASKYVTDNFENVGTDFAKEALKIHYGVTPARNIRGSSTEQEEETLKSEGISFYKFPLPKNLD